MSRPGFANLSCFDPRLHNRSMPLEWHRHYGPCRNWDNGEPDDDDCDVGDDGDDNDNGEADYEVHW